MVITSLRQLHQVDLQEVDAAICSTVLQDGCGLDALAYLHGMRPELPVILIGSEPSMAVEAIRRGAHDFVVANDQRELDLLPLTIEKCLIRDRMSRQNEQLQQQMRRSLAELTATNLQLQEVIRELENMARTDELTGLFNRRWFNLMLEGSWAEATRHGLPLACLMIDLDGFKFVNDQQGHHEGDELLRLAATVLQANCRDVDVASRYGGDEFCVLMRHIRPHEAAMVGERVLREFKHAVANRDANGRVSLSIGMAHIEISRPVNAAQLIAHADQAMYAAKHAGKSRLMVRDAHECVPLWHE